jgi:hypothetical protein
MPPIPFDAPVATLKRTGCLGTCPSYGLAPYADGSIDHRGGEFDPVETDAALRTTKEDVDWLVDLARRAGYHDLKGRYVCGIVSDLPGAKTSIRYDGRRKEIWHYHGDSTAPFIVGLMEDAIDEAARVAVPRKPGTKAEVPSDREHLAHTSMLRGLIDGAAPSRPGAETTIRIGLTARSGTSHRSSSLAG